MKMTRRKILKLVAVMPAGVAAALCMPKSLAKAVVDAVEEKEEKARAAILIHQGNVPPPVSFADPYYDYYGKGRRREVVGETWNWNKDVVVTDTDTGKVVPHCISVDESTGEYTYYSTFSKGSAMGGKRRLRIDRPAWTEKERRNNLGHARLLFKKEMTYGTMPTSS